MAIKKMEHVGIVVDDLAAATEFFVELGLEPGGTGQVEGELVDRIIALEGTKAELAMLRTPDGDVEIELVKFHSPPTEDGDPHAPSKFNAPDENRTRDHCLGRPAAVRSRSEITA